VRAWGWSQAEACGLSTGAIRPGSVECLRALVVNIVNIAADFAAAEATRLV
jgi:hypothetical protein